MKTKLLIAIAAALSFNGYAQTKGTSTLGLGVNFTNYKNDSRGSGYTSSSSEEKRKDFTLGYGNFIKDNVKLGVEFTYGKYDTDYDGVDIADAKSYGGNINYQQYYPLLKKLYAYAGGRGGYMYQKTENTNFGQQNSSTKLNEYSAGAYGGLTWFVSNRFAFETNLLSANIVYRKYATSSSTSDYENSSKQTNFNLTSQGFIDNLGFKIYLLF